MSVGFDQREISVSTLTRAIEECRSSSSLAISDALESCELKPLASKIFQNRINELCIAMGYVGCGNLPLFARLAEELRTRILEITNNNGQQNKILDYTHKVITLGRLYGSLRSAL